MKIKVPDAIIERVGDAIKPFVNLPYDVAKIACEAFAEALAENPIVPTQEQRRALEKHWMEDNGRQGAYRPYIDAVHHIAVEWQRRMFLAPEPAIAPLSPWKDNECFNCGDEAVGKSDKGLPLCRGHFQLAVIAGWNPKLYPKPEPEVPEPEVPPSSCPCCQPGVPEQVRGLLFRIEPVRDDANKMIIEAFRRGKASR